MTFSGDINRFVDKTEKKLTRTFRGTALSLFSRVVLRTPVGNPELWKHPDRAPKNYTGGRLRGAWQCQINTKPSGKNTPVDKSGGQTVSNINNVVGRATTNDTLYLINNMPYSIKVEDGRHSTQAPAGMVKVSVAEFQNLVKREARKK